MYIYFIEISKQGLKIFSSVQEIYYNEIVYIFIKTNCYFFIISQNLFIISQ